MTLSIKCIVLNIQFSVLDKTLKVEMGADNQLPKKLSYPIY